MMEVIDNFLPEEEFKEIHSLMTGHMFPWFFLDSMVEPDDGSFQFMHMFFLGSNSENLDMWDTFMKQVGAEKCERIKANLTLRTSKPYESLFHNDYDDMKTAIFYVNTNNGYTEFKNGVIVNSVANRVCLFDSNLQHRGVTHTEGDYQRIVVNFNYA